MCVPILPAFWIAPQRSTGGPKSKNHLRKLAQDKPQHLRNLHTHKRKAVSLVCNASNSPLAHCHSICGNGHTNSAQRPLDASLRQSCPTYRQRRLA